MDAKITVAAISAGTTLLIALTKMIHTYITNDRALHQSLGDTISDVSTKVNKITASSMFIDKKLAQIDKKINYLLDNQFVTSAFIDELNMQVVNLKPLFKGQNEKYLYFIDVKAESIITVAAWLHDKGFYMPDGKANSALTYALFTQQVKREMLKVKATGIEVFGEALYNSFLVSHAKNVENFMLNMSVIFESSDNGKHKKAQVLFMDLLRSSIIALKLFLEGIEQWMQS